MLGGLTICTIQLQISYSVVHVPKNYEKWLRVGKVIAKKAVCSFFCPPCIHLYDNIVFSLVNKYDDNDDSQYGSESEWFSPRSQIYTADQNKQDTVPCIHIQSAADRLVMPSPLTPPSVPHLHKTFSFRISAKPKTELGCPPVARPLVGRSIGGDGYKTLGA